MVSPNKRAQLVETERRTRGWGRTIVKVSSPSTSALWNSSRFQILPLFLYESPQIGETGRDLWVAPMTPDGHLAEGAQPKPYIHGPFAEWQARFSPEPNPRWVAYVSDETGRNEVYIASFPDPKRRLQVTSGGGTFPQWGHDGRELFYISGDGMLTVVGLKTGAAGLDLDLSSPQQLFPLTAGSSLVSPYEVSPDGKLILVNQAKQNTELHVVVNWTQLLRRQAGQ